MKKLFAGAALLLAACGTSREPAPVAPPAATEVNITVSSPAPGAEVGSPLIVEGSARVFENNVNYRLLIGERVITEGFTTALAPDVGTFGPFRFEIPFTDSGAAILEVLNYSARDGAPENVVRIPLVLRSGGTVRVFFSRPDETECGRVVSVERPITPTPAVARAALEELLKGPADTAYTTMINPDVKLNGLTIENGIAHADFSAELARGVAGACRVEAITAQIEATLKQFPSVKDVVITIDGVADALQP